MFPSLGARSIHPNFPTGPNGKSGPPQKVDQFFRNFSGWTEPIHWVLDRNFGNFRWMNCAHDLWNVRTVRCRGTPGTFRRHCSQSCMYSDETTWRPRWKILLENPRKWHFRDSLKLQNVPRCLGPQFKWLVPLVRVPKPPAIYYSLTALH